jgi:hypothetical protein
MDFLGGALPNVMFLIGVLAVGLGLGIELKLVPLNKEINRTGRIGAFVFGLLLMVGSLALYLNPSLGSRGQPSATANAANVLAAPAAPTAAAVVVAQQPTELRQSIAAPEVAPTPTQAPQVIVPDLHGQDDKGTQRALQAAGLKAQKVDTCTGADKGDAKTKKGA